MPRTRGSITGGSVAEPHGHDSGEPGVPNYDGDGLVPAIAQHADTGDVLMLAYMNAEAYARTLSSMRATFFSRSRERIWEKGETSGNTLHVRAVHLDCDRDTVLLSVIPDGPACHTGADNCFIEPVDLPRV